MAPAKKAAARSKNVPAKAKAKAKAKAAKPAKAARPSKARAHAPQGASAKGSLLARVARALGVTEAQAELRALRELAGRLGLGEPAAPAAATPPPLQTTEVEQKGTGALPKRLFVALDGRGLDGMGLPVEVIDLPCVLGSSRNCAIWINSPQIETRHAQITHGESGWVLEDLGSAHGTWFEGQKIGRRSLQHGDVFLLAGYLRLRAELRG